MADEFNPQGVDQTPRNNENPNSTADTGNAEPKNPFVGGDSVDAGNASDSSEQQAPVSSAALAADQQPTQAATDTAATEPIPDYASAKGESTVVSSSPASPAAPAAGQTSATTPLYRPAPEYGAYGPTPTQAQGQQGGQAGSNAQPTQQFPFGQPAQQTLQGQQGNRNPYYTNNPQPQGNGNPFNPPTQPQQNNGNPFASQSGQNGQNGQQPQQGGLFGFGTPGTGTPNGQGPTQPGQPGQPGPAKQGMSKTASNILIAVVAAVLAAALCLGLGYGALTSGLITLPTSNSLSNVSSNKSGSGSATAKSGEAPDWQTVASDVSGSVVSIQTALSNGTAKGSGAIIDTEGHIITNNHVVDGAQSVSVQLSDGTSLDAEIIGTDEQTDLAVIKVTPTSDLTAAEFGDSDELEPGEYAYAIGSPGGVQFANTITGGRISAINRDLTVNDRVMTLIQTDASINNGNSGGALINKYGQVVGITSAKLSGNAFGSATVEGMGFAIPINTAKDIVDELIQNGYVSGRPSIGITGQNVESADGKVSGVQVYSIDSRAKAASEGLQVGDVITAVDGTPTPDMDKVNELKQDKKAGDKLTLSVYRISTGKTLNITITLTDSHDLEGNDPNAQTQQSQSSQNDNSQQNDSYGSYGFSSPFGSFGW